MNTPRTDRFILSVCQIGKAVAEILSWSLNIAAALAFGAICPFIAFIDACYGEDDEEDRAMGVVRR